MNPIKQNDIKIGQLKEKSSLSVFENYFKKKLYLTPEFHTFDYISVDESLYIELKHRNNTCQKYPTTMIPYHKLQKGYDLIKEGKNVYYCFNFTNGIYCYKQHSQTDREIKIAKGGRCDRGRPEYNTYAYIPINLIKKISNESV